MPASPRTNSRTDRNLRLVFRSARIKAEVYQEVARARMRRTVLPTCNDRSKIAPTRTPPGSRCRETAPSAAEAMQPQLLQSGLPPNWHGCIWRLKSADMQVVACAKVHSVGDAGGLASTAMRPRGIASFG